MRREPNIPGHLRLLTRFTRVLFELGCGASIFSARRLGERMFSPRISRSSTSAVLARTLERLGPMSIKLGQILAGRPDLVGYELSAAMKRLQAGVEPLPFSTIQKVVERNIGPMKTSGIAHLEVDPVACGSIAQVHRAWLCDGTQIALKIRRPDAARMIELDLSLLRVMAKILDRSRLFASVRAERLVAEVCSMFMSQTDFLTEACCAEEFGRNFHQNRWVHIPKVYRKFTNSEMIGLEYVPELDFRTAKNSSPVTTIHGLRMLYRMIFLDGLIHADLHSGNLVFGESQVFVTDFGLVTRLDAEERDDFRDLFVAMSTRNATQCAEIILKYSEGGSRAVDSLAFHREIQEHLSQFAGKSAEEFEAAGFAKMIFMVQRQFGLIGSNRFVTTIMAIVAFESVLKRLDPEIDFQKEAMSFLVENGGSGMSHQMRTSLYATLRDEVQSSRHRWQDPDRRRGHCAVL